MCMKNLKKCSISLFVALLISFWSPAPFAQDNQMCIPALGGLTGFPTTTDGVVEGDNGWAKATQHNLNASNGVSRTAVMYTGTSTTDVYIGLIVDDPPPGADNTVLFTMSTDGNCHHDWKIEIKPWDNAVTDGPNQQPHIVDYWRDSCPNSSGTPHWNLPTSSPTSAGPGFWLADGTRVSKTGSRWELEMKIPRETNPVNAGNNSKIYFPPTGEFKLYADILSTSTILGTVSQAAWPPTTTISGPGPLEQLAPPKSDWGTVSLNARTACTGLSLAWNDIGTTNPDQHLMRIAPPPYPPMCTDTAGPTGPNNTFFANVHNDGPNAPGVSVTFKIANWGIPSMSSWAPIGPAGVSDSNPTVPDNVPSGGKTFNMNWAPTCAQSKAYHDSGHLHQCILVEMDSDDASVRFKNRGVTRNMDFVTASHFERKAEISAKGYGAPPDGRAKQQFLLSVDTRVQKYQKDGNYYIPQRPASSGKESIPTVPEPGTGSIGTNGHVLTASAEVPPTAQIPSTSESLIPARYYPKGLSEAMIWKAYGYLKTGKKIIINGHGYENAKYVGSFGYVVGHSGPVKDWKADLRGGGLTPVQGAPGNQYQLQVPEDGVADVTTSVDAVPPAKCQCFGLKCP